MNIEVYNKTKPKAYIINKFLYSYRLGLVDYSKIKLSNKTITIFLSGRVIADA